MILSFYSYKGGVGRTQLCANTAAYLCYKKGKRVLLWDWDFEAPGLHFYFKKENKDINKKGTLELFENYVRLMRSKSGIKKEDLEFVTQENIIPLTASTEGEKACIDLLPAGDLTSDFSSRINNFNWFEFYELLDGMNYIELFKEEIKKLGYDYIFIDSRTGVSDYSGICNIQLPDMNVLIMAANKQNFSGCKRIAKQIENSDYVKKGFRKPVLMPILSRLDESSPDFSKWANEFTDDFSYMMPFLDNTIEEEFQKDIFSDVYFKETFLKYVATISTGENLLFSKEKQRLSKLSFEQEYINIAEFIENVKEHKNLQIRQFIDKDTWLGYAEIAAKEKNNKKAAMAFDNAGEFDKANEFGGTENSWFKKGSELFQKKEYDNAILFFEKAININPKSYFSRMWISMAYDFKGNDEKAAQFKQEADKYMPKEVKIIMDKY